MTAKLCRLALPACIFVVTARAFGGPDATTDAPAQVRQPPVVKWHKKVVETVLVACGVATPPPIYVPPGYLETTGPAPMMVYRPAGAMRPRRVSHTGAEDRPAAVAPAASALPVPAVGPAAPAGGAPITAPLPSPAAAPAASPAAPAADPASPEGEPGILPEPDGRRSSAGGRTDEMLSYFQRQHAASRPYSASPLPPGEGAPNDPGSEPAFLQVPQAPEQPVLPPSRATYHVVP